MLVLLAHMVLGQRISRNLDKFLHISRLLDQLFRLRQQTELVRAFLPRPYRQQSQFTRGHLLIPLEQGRATHMCPTVGRVQGATLPSRGQPESSFQFLRM